MATSAATDVNEAGTVQKHKRPWLRWGMAVAAALLVAVVTIAVWPRRADDSQLVVGWTGSGKFTESQVQGLIGDVKGTLMEYDGCTLREISYEEDWSDGLLAGEEQDLRENPGYESSVLAAMDEYGRDRMAAVRTEFDCRPNAGDGSWSDHNTPTFYYAYAPDDADAARSGWVFVDSGY